MPASRRSSSSPPDRASLPRTTGLPPGWEFIPAWERGDPLPAPPAPPFDLHGTLQLLSKRLSRSWVRDPFEIMPIRMERREAWFWINLVVCREFEKFKALDLDQSPDPETVREFIRSHHTRFGVTHLPQMLLAFFTVEETLDWLFNLQWNAYYSSLDPMVGIAMFITPYLPNDQRSSLITQYLVLIGCPPSWQNAKDKAALHILAALGHTELFSGLIASATSQTIRHGWAYGLWFSALPDRETFLRETSRLGMKSITGILEQRWWIACVRHHAPERLFPCPDVYRMVAPEIAPVMLGWLKQKGASAPAAAWLKRNFEVAVAGLAPLLETSDQSADASAWFTLQWEQHPAKLESALRLLTDRERQSVQSLHQPVRGLADVPSATAGAHAYLVELSPFMERPAKGWSKPPAWLTVSRLTPLSVPGHPVDPDFMQAVLHHLAAPEKSGNAFHSALMQCVPAGVLENFCAEMMQQWTAVQHPKESN